MSTSVTNEVILASAGSGKTFRLSDRIIQLLAHQARPEEIVALTFTRAAAAEFVAKTLAKLAEAAANPAKAKELGQRLQLKDPQAACRRLLRTTLLSIHRMTLGTLDSFFARLVANYPTEVGLDGQPIRNLDEIEQARIRRQLISQMVQETPAEELEQLWASLRALQGGEDSAEPLRTLDEQIQSLHSLFTLAPEAERWGLPAHLSGPNAPWCVQPEDHEITTATRTLRDWLGRQSFHKTFRVSLAAQIECLAAMRHAADLADKDWTTLGERMLPVVTGEEGAAVELFYSRQPITFPADIAAAYRILARHAHHLSLQAASDETRALHHLLERYERRYATEVRQRGQLTFSDYVTLLLGAEQAGTKLDLDYRLDCRIKHWLFDEFQDTSTAQWLVLANNLQEAATDADTWRTEFFVGDLKQSLYSWRGGNPELLRRVSQDPRWHGGKEVTRLDTTRRCSAPVVELLNTLLGHLVPHGVFFSPRAAQKWADVFQPHVSAAEQSALGSACWVRLKQADDEDDAEDSIVTQASWIAADLRHSGLIEGHLLKSGLTCAVLVSSNHQAARITEALRRHGIEAADEAQTLVATDNPFTAGLTALVDLAAHPSDSFSRGVAGMCPTANRYVAAAGGWNSATRQIASDFLAGGAEAVVQGYLRHAQLEGDDNATRFLRKRAQQLLNLAVGFDAAGDRQLQALAEHLNSSHQRDTANPRAVQVLTIHRAKGLEYTVVYLPCLNNPRHKIVDVRTTQPLCSINPATFAPDWILCRPRAETSRLDPSGLGRALETEITDSAYESLCKLYVGMTRAIRRLVLLTCELSQTTRNNWGTEKLHGKFDYAMLVEAVLTRTDCAPQALTLPGARPAELMWQCGTDDWLSAVAPSTAAPTPLRPLPPLPTISRLERLRPSQADQSFSGPWQPPGDASAGREFGTRVHALLEHLEWDCTAFLQQLGRAQPESTNEAHQAEAIATLTRCLQSPTVAALLQRPSPDAVLWREQPALLRHEGKMISAMFDRVQIIPGRAAVIIDYKTNVGAPAELLDHYSGQMRLYRTCVAQLCRLPPASVRCVLIHVRTGTLVEV